MDIMATLLGGKSSELLGDLTAKGFSMDQAKAFLPDALSGIMGAADKQGLSSLLSMGGSEQVNALMSGIDVQSLAGKLGGDTALATSGIQALIPKVLEVMKGGAAGSLGGLAGMAKGLFG